MRLDGPRDLAPLILVVILAIVLLAMAPAAGAQVLPPLPPPSPSDWCDVTVTPQDVGPGQTVVVRGVTKEVSLYGATVGTALSPHLRMIDRWYPPVAGIDIDTVGVPRLPGYDAAISGFSPDCPRVQERQELGDGFYRFDCSDNQSSDSGFWNFWPPSVGQNNSFVRFDWPPGTAISVATTVYTALPSLTEPVVVPARMSVRVGFEVRTCWAYFRLHATPQVSFVDTQAGIVANAFTCEVRGDGSVKCPPRVAQTRFDKRLARLRRLLEEDGDIRPATSRLLSLAPTSIEGRALTARFVSGKDPSLVQQVKDLPDAELGALADLLDYLGPSQLHGYPNSCFTWRFEIFAKINKGLADGDPRIINFLSRWDARPVDGHVPDNRFAGFFGFGQAAVGANHVGVRVRPRATDLDRKEWGFILHGTITSSDAYGPATDATGQYLLSSERYWHGGMAKLDSDNREYLRVRPTVPFTVSLSSDPARFLFVNRQGQRFGILPNGMAVNELPYDFIESYLTVDENGNPVAEFNLPRDSYRLLLTGVVDTPLSVEVTTADGRRVTSLQGYDTALGRGKRLVLNLDPVGTVSRQRASVFTKGSIGPATDRFEVAARRDGEMLSGKVFYQRRSAGITFVGTAVTGLTASGSTATVIGTGTLNGVSGFGFTATLDAGTPKTLGFEIVGSDGRVRYSEGPTALTRGKVVVSP